MNFQYIPFLTVHSIFVSTVNKCTLGHDTFLITNVNEQIVINKNTNKLRRFMLMFCFDVDVKLEMLRLIDG